MTLFGSMELMMPDAMTYQPLQSEDAALKTAGASGPVGEPEIVGDGDAWVETAMELASEYGRMLVWGNRDIKKAATEALRAHLSTPRVAGEQPENHSGNLTTLSGQAPIEGDARLTREELAAIMEELSEHHYLNDFTPKCPTCTAHRKIAAMLASGAAAGATSSNKPESELDKFCEGNCTWLDHHPNCPRKT